MNDFYSKGIGLSFVPGSWKKKKPSDPLEFPQWLECLWYSWWDPGVTPEFMLISWLMVGSKTFNVNEMTHDGGQTTPEIPVMWLVYWSFELCDISLSSWEWRDAGDGIQPLRFTNSCLRNKIPIKLWWPKVRWGSWLVINKWCESDRFWGHGSFLFAPRAFSLGLFWLIGICLLYNKIISIALTWVLWVILANFEPKTLVGNCTFVTCWSEHRWPWNPELVSGVWCESSLVESYAINLWNLT